jgi:hypothetical protein
VDIELLVLPDCPNGAAAAELITVAVADTRVRATIIRTIIASPDQAQQRGFTGSPTILLNGSDPFARPDAPVAMSCRLTPPLTDCEVFQHCGICDKRSSGSPQARQPERKAAYHDAFRAALLSN